MNKTNTFIRFYKKLRNDHLLLVDSIESGTLIGVGDVMAQTFIEDKRLKEVDLLRTAQFFTLGAVIVGPGLSLWYKFLSTKIKQTGRFWVVKKVIIDQTTLSPAMIATRLIFINALEGRDFKYIKAEMWIKYPQVMSMNYKIWPAVQFFNFYFVPVRYQVLLVQCVALFWNAYLAFKTKEGKED